MTLTRRFKHLPPRAVSGRTVRAAGLYLAALACLCQPAGAQTEAYCTITGVKWEQLSNAVRITIEADGALRTRVQRSDFYEGAPRRFRFVDLDVIPFELTNARSAVGNFVDISAYPVSYLKLSTPLDAREGVGLECELHLYRTAVAGRIRTDNEQLGGGWMFREVQVDMERSQSGTEFYITVTSDKHVDLSDVPGATVQPGELPVRLLTGSTEDGRLRVEALNAPLHEAVQQVAELAGVRVVVDDEVQRLLSCRLENLDIEQLLHTIARGYGLAVAARDGTYYVTNALPSNVASYWGAGTIVIPLYHQSTSQIMAMLPDYVLRFVRPSRSGNAIMATGPAPLLDKLRADIEKLDRPGLQVTVRAMLVEAISDADARRALQLMVTGGTTEFALDADAAALRFGVTDRRASEIAVNLRSLRRQAAVDLRVRPHVTVLSGQEAEFFFGETQYFTFQTSTWRGPRVTIESADVGVRLQVTPWGASPEYIQVPVEVEASNIMAVGPGGQPRVARRVATSCMAMSSGDTLVIAGLEMSAPTYTRQQTAPGMLPWPLGQMASSRTSRQIMRTAIVLLQVDARS